LVTHSVDALRRLCRRCAVLQAGTLLGLFPTEEAIERRRPPVAFSALDVDTSACTRDRVAEGKIARLVRVRVLSTEGLHFDQPFTLELTLDVNEPVPAGVVEFIMNTIEGQRVMTLGTAIEGQRLSLRPGRSVVRMSLDRLPVSPGRYLCDAAISGAVPVDAIQDFVEWEVGPGVHGGVGSAGFGGCRPRPVVEFVGPDDL
jgi:hypothetical protein